MTNDWLVGENRACASSTLKDSQGKPTGQIVSLNCPTDNGPLESHNMDIEFHGDTRSHDASDKPIAVPMWWTCTRHSDGFSCKVMGK